MEWSSIGAIALGVIVVRGSQDEGWKLVTSDITITAPREAFSGKWEGNVSRVSELIGR